LNDTTNSLLKQLPSFLNKLNQNFDFVRVDRFIFEGSDYAEVARKETLEICQILEIYRV